jgi:hypothetical protein
MEIISFIAERISKRKKEILRMIEIDLKIGADPYDNLARLKEVERIEKILKQEPFRRNKKGGD